MFYYNFLFFLYFSFVQCLLFCFLSFFSILHISASYVTAHTALFCFLSVSFFKTFIRCLIFVELYRSLSFLLFGHFSFFFPLFFCGKSLKLKHVHSTSLENDIKVDAYGISNFYFDSVCVVVKYI